MLKITTVVIGGMTCGSCVSSITSILEKNFSNLDPDFKCTISLLTETGVIEYNDELVDVKSIMESIEDCGFDCQLVKTEDKRMNKKSIKSADDDGNDDGDDSVLTYRTEVSIGGMTCGSCVSSITQQLENLDGVLNVTVSLLTENGLITHIDKISPDLIKETVEDCGFDCNIIKTELLTSNKQNNLDDIQNVSDIEEVNLRIFGMTCSSCSNSIETQVSKLNGIISCNVALVTETAHIGFDSNLIGIRDIITAIEDCGFDAVINNSLDNTSQMELLSKVKDIQYWKSTFFRLAIFGFPVFFFGHILPMFNMIFKNHKHHMIKIYHNIYLEILIQFIISTYIQFFLGRRFYINSYKGLKHGSGSMDLLISISTTTLYVYSVSSMVVCMFSSFEYVPNVLFDTASMLFLFVSIGKWVESKSKGSTSTALSKLLSLTPSSCIIIDGTFIDLKEKLLRGDVADLPQRTIGIDLLQKNDIVVILPGSRIPTDGVCIFGRSEVDESLLTGESRPVMKTVNSNLIGGSVNTTSTLYMKVEKLGENTQLQKIVKLVRDAQISKIPIQRFADRIASKFVPTIIFLSLLTFIGWYSYVSCTPINKVANFFKNKEDPTQIQLSKVVQVAISVVVVACPCALGLAAPTAIMVGTGVGATNGILIKGGEVLEHGNSVNCVVFDKTGTLTKGKMKLINYKFIPNSKIYNDELLIWNILHTIEKNSEHPVGKAITNYANHKLGTKDSLISEVKEIDTVVGVGINAIIIDKNQNQLSVKIGNSKMIVGCKINNLQDFTNCLNEINGKEQISSVSHIIINDEYVGYVELADSLKKDVKRTIATLLSMGYSVGMVTGDNAKTAKYIANQVGIPLSNVLSEAKPDEKIKFVQTLQDKLNLNVAFVGDGINDAPALMQADLGIAIATGTDIAIDAADIVLLSSERLPTNSTRNTTIYDYQVTQSNDFGEEEEEEEEDYDVENQTYNDEQLSTSSNTLYSGGIGGVVAALSISKATFRSIKSNFFFAMVYNLILLPVAMGFLIIPFGITMHPMFAAAAMASSSVTVVLNSLRLKNWKVSFVEPTNSLFYYHNVSMSNPTNLLSDSTATPVHQYDIESSASALDDSQIDLTNFNVEYFRMSQGKSSSLNRFLSRNSQSFSRVFKNSIDKIKSKLFNSSNNDSITRSNKNLYEMIPSTYSA